MKISAAAFENFFVEKTKEVDMKMERSTPSGIPVDLKSFRFTAGEKLLIDTAKLSSLPPSKVEMLHALVVDESAEPFERQAVKGLLARHGKGDEDVASANYGQRFDDPSKQINLFENVLRMPLVNEAFKMSIASACRALANSKHATLMDIGLGKGDSLAIVQRNVASLAVNIKVQVTCETIHSYAEDLDWSSIKSKVKGDLVVLSNFTLHHLKKEHPEMQVGARIARDNFFAGLGSLHPVLVNIIEPDSDHLTDDLQRRMAFLLLHFRAVKEYISGVDCTDADRTERHEPYYAWQKRFLCHGFQPSNIVIGEGSGDHRLEIKSIPGVARLFCSQFPILSLLSFSCKQPVVDLSLNIPEASQFYPKDASALKGALIEHLHSTEALPFDSTVGLKHLHVSAGSANILSLLSRVVSEEFDILTTLDHEFPIIKTFAKTVESIPVRSHHVLDMDLKALSNRLRDLAELNKSVAVCFSNPQGVTGGWVAKTALEKLIREFPSVLFIVDECYIQYTQKAETMLETAITCDNVVLVRSFSKDFGLAGSRVGFMVARTHWIDRVKQLDILRGLLTSSQEMALEALATYALTRDRCNEVIRTREIFQYHLSLMGLELLPSKANFVAFSHQEAPEIARELEEGFGFRVAVRQSGSNRLVRITVPPLRLLGALETALSSIVSRRHC
ncbi:Putative phenylalanine aminotransferase [Seminavis robusta]|uniref:histidinol-phosphate transaminase n=1 Tax=Seminavis robusta TaxID=568900 RepID=A0A9N8EFZ3_9STRA|nr:Putative phenylalanine aminotransferase [Seminavis robusta]|eukprot:Sro1067_g237440.1 Putative phenylalanine aminotransferase (675) ;mRNA; r:32736-34933